MTVEQMTEDELRERQQQLLHLKTIGRITRSQAADLARIEAILRRFQLARSGLRPWL